MIRTLFLLALVVASPSFGDPFLSKRAPIKRPPPKVTKSTPSTSATSPRTPANSAGTTTAAPTTPPPPVTSTRIRIVSDEDEQRVYSFKLNTFLGYQVTDASAASLGVQGGFAVSRPTPLFVGPEVSYTLFSEGRLLSFLLGGWYEMRLFGSPRFSVVVGGLGGIGMTDNLVNLKKNVLVAYLDAALSQDVDDLVSLRAQFRPGVVGDYFSFAMNLSVSFRFL